MRCAPDCDRRPDCGLVNPHADPVCALWAKGTPRSPRSPAQPDAVELLRELHAMWPDIRQLQDGFMENSPGENWSEWDQRVRQWCIEFGPRIDAFLRGGSNDKPKAPRHG